jgi:hypothetical protein
MQTRQELILQFMVAIAGSSATWDQFERMDGNMVATSIYLRAAKLADEYLSFC